MKNVRFPSFAAVLLFGGLSITAAFILLANGFPAWFWALFIIGIILLIAGIVEMRSSSGQNGSGKNGKKPLPEYRVKKALLTAPEKEFYRLLRRVLSPEHFEVFPQIALAAVIDKLTQNSYRNELFRIPDFCVADAKSFEPLLMIELNDASHQKPERAERDRKVREICAAADLPIASFDMQEARDEAFVIKTLKKLL